jgi:hypothetical protein
MRDSIRECLQILSGIRMGEILRRGFLSEHDRAIVSLQVMLFLEAIIGKSIYFGVVSVSKHVGGVRLSWEDLLIVCLVILGVVLFLYGSNYNVINGDGSNYNIVIGWAGVVLIVGGIVGGIVLKALESVRKRRD